MSGKTTFFDAVSCAVTPDTQKIVSNIRNIKVIDSRLEKLRTIYEPKKYSPAEINVIDNYISASEYSRNNTVFNRQTLENIQKSEVVILLIRAFSNAEKPYFKEKVEPFIELKNIFEEMCLLDLINAEKRIERMKKENKKNLEYDTISKCFEQLQNNKPVYQLNLSDDEMNSLSGFKFLTQNKMLAVINCGDSAEFAEDLKKIDEFAALSGLTLMKLNAEIEFEISQFDNENDKLEFLKEYGLTESAVNRFVGTIYEMMGLISFFTVGPDEVKAWTIRKNTSALKAAGKIHSDIERGFIRAEIMAYNDFIEAGGNVQKLKAAGKIRLEGKDYIVDDGDIINFRFNV